MLTICPLIDELAIVSTLHQQRTLYTSLLETNVLQSESSIFQTHSCNQYENWQNAANQSILELSPAAAMYIIIILHTGQYDTATSA